MAEIKHYTARANEILCNGRQAAVLLPTSCTKKEAHEMAIAAANFRNAVDPDAARYRRIFDAGLPITFMGVEYEDKASLDAAIDADIAHKGKP